MLENDQGQIYAFQASIIVDQRFRKQMSNPDSFKKTETLLSLVQNQNKTGLKKHVKSIINEMFECQKLLLFTLFLLLTFFKRKRFTALHFSQRRTRNVSALQRSEDKQIGSR